MDKGMIDVFDSYFDWQKTLKTGVLRERVIRQAADGSGFASSMPTRMQGDGICTVKHSAAACVPGAIQIVCAT
jgi:hypothetical protein